MKENNAFFDAINLMRFIVTHAAQNNAYDWSATTCKNNIDKSFEDIRKHEKYGTEKFWRDVFALSEEQKSALGFRKFDENDEKMCIPMWIWQCLPDDMLFEGKPKKDLDNDIRLGCVWWKA